MRYITIPYMQRNFDNHALMTVFAGFFFQAKDGIRDVERSRGLGDVYKRQDDPGIAV